MTESDVAIVSEDAVIGPEGALVRTGPRATRVQIGALVGFAALIAVMLAVALVASRR